MTVSCYLLQGSWNRKLVKKSKDSKQKYKTDEFTPVEPKSFTKDRKKIIHLRCSNLPSVDRRTHSCGVQVFYYK